MEQTVLRGVEALRKTCDETSYLERCREMCIEEGLKENSVRRVVWSHVLLGVGTQPLVPSVEDAAAPSCSSHCSSSENPSGDESARASQSGGSTPASTAKTKRGEVAEDQAGERGSPEMEEEKGKYTSENCQPRIVHVDVQRSLWLLYPDAGKRNAMRVHLQNILLCVLHKNVERYYYQGLHELLGFVMYVMEGSAEEVVHSVCGRLLQVQLRSFSDKKLNQSQSMLYAMHAVVAEEDVTLATALESCGVAPESHYAVAWLITWYSHICEDVKVLARLFDFFVACNNEHAVVFFTAALVLHERNCIIDWIREVRESVDGDELMTMACVYTRLTQLPKSLLTTKNIAAVEDILRAAMVLQERQELRVQLAREEFLQGKVTKLGMLADKRTRNSALRLLWNLLFREWRTPWKRHNVMTPVVIAMLAMVVAVTLRMTTSSVPRLP